MPRPPASRVSTIVELRANGGEAVAGDAIGLAALARDQPAPLQPAEEGHRAVGEEKAVPREAVGGEHPPALVAAAHDAAALCQRVQHALFVPGDVH